MECCTVGDYEQRVARWHGLNQAACQLEMNLQVTELEGADRERLLTEALSARKRADSYLQTILDRLNTFARMR